MTDIILPCGYCGSCGTIDRVENIVGCAVCDLWLYGSDKLKVWNTRIVPSNAELIHITKIYREYLFHIQRQVDIMLGKLNQFDGYFRFTLYAQSTDIIARDALTLKGFINRGWFIIPC